jgi:hypothetical protein
VGERMPWDVEDLGEMLMWPVGESGAVALELRQ